MSRSEVRRVTGVVTGIGPGGFEPPLTDPKSAVLPLDEGPASPSVRKWYLDTRPGCNASPRAGLFFTSGSHRVHLVYDIFAPVGPHWRRQALEPQVPSLAPIVAWRASACALCRTRLSFRGDATTGRSRRLLSPCVTMICRPRPGCASGPEPAVDSSTGLTKPRL